MLKKALLLGLFFTCFSGLAQTSSCVFMYDKEAMNKSKSLILKGERQSKLRFGELKKAADKVLNSKPTSVMDKGIIPPSGDKHDYISQGPYWWPDPNKADGLPYIRRDGEVNPEIKKFKDHDNMRKLFADVDVLSKAYFITEEEKYAEKAIEFIRVWFLNPETKMNPHLEYGQGIPGINEGRSIGIIETPGLTSIVDGICLLRASRSWTNSDEEGMQDWMKAYLDWLINSEHGKKEAIHPNNHGTWYDVQAGSLALFTNQIEVLRTLMQAAQERRFDRHIIAGGEQPHETERTKGFSYSAMNLMGLFKIAILAEKVEIDYWNYKNKNGASLQDALDFLLPFAMGEKELPFKQISPIKADILLPQLWIANKKYQEPKYESIYRKIEGELLKDDTSFLY